MAFALGEDRDEHVGARHFLAAGRLDVDDGALDDALEAGRRLGVLVAVGDEVLELVVDVVDAGSSSSTSTSTEQARITAAASGVVGQRQKQMFERRVFVMALVGERQCAMQGLFEVARKMTASGEPFTSFP